MIMPTAATCLAEDRRIAAEIAYEAYSFNGATVAAADGWQVSADVWERRVCFDVGLETMASALLRIDFGMGSAVIRKVG